MPRVGVSALNADYLLNFQGARCAGCEPLTLLLWPFGPTSFLILHAYYKLSRMKNQPFSALFLLILVLNNVYTFYLFYHLAEYCSTALLL